MYKLSCYIQELEKEAAIRKQNDVLLEWSRILNNRGGEGWLAGFNPLLSKFSHLVRDVHLMICHL